MNCSNSSSRRRGDLRCRNGNRRTTTLHGRSVRMSRATGKKILLHAGGHDDMATTTLFFLSLVFARLLLLLQQRRVLVLLPLHAAPALQCLWFLRALQLHVIRKRQLGLLPGMLDDSPCHAALLLVRELERQQCIQQLRCAKFLRSSGSRSTKTKRLHQMQKYEATAASEILISATSAFKDTLHAAVLRSITSSPPWRAPAAVAPATTAAAAAAIRLVAS